MTQGAVIQCEGIRYGRYYFQLPDPSAYQGLHFDDDILQALGLDFLQRELEENQKPEIAECAPSAVSGLRLECSLSQQLGGLVEQTMEWWQRSDHWAVSERKPSLSQKGEPPCASARGNGSDQHGHRGGRGYEIGAALL